jgi:flagellar motor switch protein FliN
MADEADGLLSQDDINAALAAAGLAGEAAEAVESEAPVTGASAAAPEPRLDSAGRPFDEVAAAMAEAIASEAASAPTPVPLQTRPLEIPPLTPMSAGSGPNSQGIDLLRDVELDVKIELGRSRMLVDDVLRLGEGSVVELDKLAGDPVDVFVNNRLVAHGEVLVLNDTFCVRINEIVVKPEEHSWR